MPVTSTDIHCHIDILALMLHDQFTIGKTAGIQRRGQVEGGQA